MDEVDRAITSRTFMVLALLVRHGAYQSDVLIPIYYRTPICASWSCNDYAGLYAGVWEGLIGHLLYTPYELPPSDKAEPIRQG